MSNNDFKVMDDREYMLHRPEIFIGSMNQADYHGIYNFKYQTKTYVPALLKIIEEILDNCVDESIRTSFEYANIIAVDIRKDDANKWYVEVSDNGRGIPVVQHDGVYQAELAWCKPRAGSNFTDDGRVTIGRNGVGSACTNYFSTEFIGKSGDGNTLVTVHTTNNCNEIKTNTKKSKEKGTTVKFYPDLERFGVKEINQDIIDMIEDRLTNLSICYPKVAFKFNDKRVNIKNSSQLAKSFNEHAISLDADQYNIVVSNAGDDEEFRHLSYFNGINIKNGGNHIDFFVITLCEELIPLIKRKWKIDVLPNQIKQHLLIAFWVRNYPNLKFDSQSKERITNTWGELKKFLEIDFAKLAKKIVANEEIIMPAIDAILRKKEAIDKRAATNALKKIQKKKIANHISANDKDPMKKTIFIAEGQSASSMGISVRDPKYHGFYSLRGKVMNTHDMSDLDILSNKELSELITIIGLDLNTDSIYDDSGQLVLNYGRIAILTDADPDGAAIFCLLLKFFSRWPDLFKNNHIVRVETPLYIARKKGKQDQYFYTTAEYDAASNNLSGWTIDYMKGLGSLEKMDYKETIIVNPKVVTVKLDNIEKLDMAFGNSPDDRKDWMLDL